MQTFSAITELRRSIATHRKAGQSIGFVPTMGNLHAGHLKLIDSARKACDVTVCSIFVNPLQFAANEDLGNYPRTLDADTASLEQHHCDYLFLPSVAEMYPLGTEQHTLVSAPGLGDDHCGRSRPGHFDGVATVVSKLFNIVLPDQAFFGLKDYQQYLVIARMVEDLRFPISIHGVETERESTGLAMSSRNNYLSQEQKAQAAALYKCLQQSAQELLAGRRDFAGLEQQAKEFLQAAGLQTDYYTVCHATTLAPAGKDDSKLVILAAVFLGKTRLIDNKRINLI